MDIDITCIIIGYILAFIAGFLIMLGISIKRPQGTIIIEERPDEDSDLFRFDLPIGLDEIKSRKQLVFRIEVEKNASHIMRDDSQIN